MNKELLKKAEELLPKERLLLLEENNTDKSNNEMTHAYNLALSDSRQALPAIIELVREEIRDKIEKLPFRDLFTQQEIIDMQKSQIALILIASYTKLIVEERQKVITMISSLT